MLQLCTKRRTEYNVPVYFCPMSSYTHGVWCGASVTEEKSGKK